MRLHEPGIGRSEQLIRDIVEAAQPFDTPEDLNRLAESLARKKVVMLGEASHGTHEFYQWRTVLTQKLVEQHGFNFVAVEGDWPPCSRLNDYIHGAEFATAKEALGAFHRWPTWMWANQDVALLADWMKYFNARMDIEQRVSFYGLDVYSLFESMQEAIARVAQFDRNLAQTLQAHYDCFEPYHQDEKAYVRALMMMPEGCKYEVLESLRLLLKTRLETISESAPLLYRHALFDAQQNARIAARAENYYRTMVFGEGDSWNVRDSHMHDTLKLLLDHHGPSAKAIVWAHNTHIGDYRATDMLDRGHINIGGLARETWGDDRVALVGFGTHQGEVIASHAWGGPIETMNVPPGREGSYEDGFHKAAERMGAGALALDLTAVRDSRPSFREVRGHRAIGVVYDPSHERFGNYVPTSLSGRYDAFLFFDHTSALKPLPQKADLGEIPETWPEGL